MNIIKEGRKPQKPILRFQCDMCGCVYEADETEYKVFSYGRSSVCPCCGKTAHKVISPMQKRNCTMEFFCSCSDSGDFETDEYEIVTDGFFKMATAYTRCPKCGKRCAADFSDTYYGW